MKCMRVALGVACAVGFTVGNAYAANDAWYGPSQESSQSHESIRTAVGACHKLPVSERGICKAEAQMHQDLFDVSLPAAALPVSPGYVIPDRAAFDWRITRYKTLASECHQAPVSERGSCVDEASLGRARPAQLARVA